MNKKNGVLVRHRGKLISAVIVLLSFPVAYYFFIVRNPLPSDEAMIAHFKVHRSDIEELVRRYRNYGTDLKVDHSLWFKEDDTQEVMLRAGVDNINHAATSPWLPDPYTTKTANKINYKIDKARDFSLFYKYGSLMVRFAPRYLYRVHHLRYFNIWKELYFIPQVPRVENGEILWPLNAKGEYSDRVRLIKSLNDFPMSWEDYECVYREIDTHWYLRLCNGH